MWTTYGKTLRTAAAGIGLLLAGQSADAATITFDQTAVNTTPGSLFTLTVIGQDFTAGTNGSTSSGTSGGGLSLSWDPSVITLASLADVAIIFPGDEFFASAPVLNSAAGTLSFSVTSFNGTYLTDFDIAQLTFSANPGGGVCALNLAVSPTDVWADGDSLTDMTPSAVGALVTVSAVPLPAPVLLLGSGLLGMLLVGRGRRAVS